MDFFNYYFRNKNKSNDSDIGMKFNEKKENELINKYENNFLKLVNNTANNRLKIINKNPHTKYIPEYLKKELIYNFITLNNETFFEKINLVKYSLNAAIEDDKYITYMISFYSDFLHNHPRPFNIFFICSFLKNSQDFKELNLKKNLCYVTILGSKPASDISFGTDIKLLKSKMVNIFKDEPIELIYNQSRINNYLNKRENITKDKYQRGFPLKSFNTIEPVLIFPHKKFKIQLDDQCLYDKNNKVDFVDCKYGNKYTYNGLNIKNKNNYCLSYHNDGNVSFVPCNTEGKCKQGEKINNCRNFKFRKYGSLEIDDLDLCLDIDLKSKNCIEAKDIKVIYK